MTTLHTEARTTTRPSVAFTRINNISRATVAWRYNDVILADVCVMFERLGLRVAGPRSVTVHRLPSGFGGTTSSSSSPTTIRARHSL